MLKLNQVLRGGLWMAVLALGLPMQGAFASSNDITVSGPGFSFSVRGSGGWVCSAEDTFERLPFIARGESRAEAEAMAQAFAAENSSRGSFFVKTISCEPTRSGRGSITVVSSDVGISLVAEGPTHTSCIAKDSFDKIPFIAKADTQTEANAMASRACTQSNSRQGFFCKATCETIRTQEGVAGSVRIGDNEVSIGGFKIPFGKRR